MLEFVFMCQKTSQSEIEEMRRTPLWPNWSVSVTDSLTNGRTGVEHRDARRI